jgi:hypothetical protein
LRLACGALAKFLTLENQIFGPDNPFHLMLTFCWWRAVAAGVEPTAAKLVAVVAVAANDHLVRFRFFNLPITQ